MAKTKAQKENKRATLRKQVAEILTSTFADIKASVGDKKFSKKVKKASKVLAAGADKKPAKTKAKAPKKAAETKVAS